MIFDSDILIATIVLIVGMGYFTVSMVEHTDSYADAVRLNILYDRASDQLKSLVSDGTLESAILLINNGYGSMAEEVLKNRINLENYRLSIGNYTISRGYLDNKDKVVVSTLLVMNRTEGWYGIYGDNTTLYITDRHFLSEDEGYLYLNTQYHNYSYRKVIYYSDSVDTVKVTLIYGD